jgi:hypothetical protein
MVAVSTPGQAAAWTEPPPTDAELHPGTADAPAPIADGYARVTSPPVVPLPSPPAHHSPDEEEYPNAAAAARSAAKSAETAARAAAAAASFSTLELPRTPEATEPQEESQPACDDDLPSTPSDAPTPPPAAAEDDPLDALTRRFEELKQRM